MHDCPRCGGEPREESIDCCANCGTVIERVSIAGLLESGRAVVCCSDLCWQDLQAKVG